MNRSKITGILLLLIGIMISSVFSVMTQLTTGSDVTRTTVRNGYVVNPDNITISMDGNITEVLIGQNVQFMCGGNKSGKVTVTGVAGTPTEGHVVTSDSTGWLDTSWMVEGMYNATYGEHWELLVVDSPEIDLRFKVDGYEVNRIIGGTPLRIDFTSNLDKDDCVDLRISDPDGFKLTQNPADPDQKFDDINVSQLLEYGSENESKQINTTGWKVGTYTFSVRTEEENARGLDVRSEEIELDVYKCGIRIKAEKTKVVKLEKVKLRVAGCLYHNITINSSDPAHTLFPAGYADNPPYDTSGFNDIIDSPDGEKEYVVYFSETGTYTITVRDTTADSYDSVDIKVLEAPQLYVSISKNAVSPGDSFEVYGNASSDYVEIVAISPEGGNGTGMEGLYGVSIYTVPAFNPDETGSYKIHVFIDRTDSVGNTVSLGDTAGFYNLNETRNLILEEPIEINGTTNRPPGTNLTMSHLNKTYIIHTSITKNMCTEES